VSENMGAKTELIPSSTLKLDALALAEWNMK
jgi:hypothetical protein